MTHTLPIDPDQLYELHRVPALLGYRAHIYRQWQARGWVRTHHTHQRNSAQRVLYITGTHALELYQREQLHRRQNYEERMRQRLAHIHPDALYALHHAVRGLGWRNDIHLRWLARGWVEAHHTEAHGTRRVTHWVTGAHLVGLCLREIAYRDSSPHHRLRALPELPPPEPPHPKHTKATPAPSQATRPRPQHAAD